MFYTAEKLPSQTGRIILRDGAGNIAAHVAVGFVFDQDRVPSISEWLVNLINSNVGEFCLTPIQHTVMRFCQEKYDESQICPSVREIMDACELSSLSHVHRIIEEIEEKGFVRKVPNKHRNIVILKRVRT